jgi:hypothetical protein
MKLLLQTIEQAEIVKIRLLLESRGIPVYIGNEIAARYFGFMYPARLFALWIPLDHQYDDAVALLKDETHEVEKPVDISHYYESIEAARTDSTEQVYNGIMLAFVLILILGFILFIYSQNA